MDRPAASGAPPGAVTVEFRPLHLYLKNRFADTVVLTFAQIEDLLGHTLPATARAEPEWWANTDAGGAPSVQSRSWMLADRLATANLFARTVTFVRA